MTASLSNVQSQPSSSIQKSIPRGRRGLRFWYVGAGLLIVSGLSVLFVTYWLQAAEREKEQNPSVYALIHVNRQEPSILPDGGRTSGETDLEYERFRQIQMVLVRHRRVLERALHDPKVAALLKEHKRDDAIDWLEKNLRVKFLNYEIFRISFADGQPEQQVVIVNAVTEAYMWATKLNQESIRREKLDTLKGIVAKYENRLRDKRQQLNELTEAVGTRNAADADFRREQARDQLKDVTRELRRLRLAQVAARVKLARLREKAVGVKEAAAPKLEEEIAILVEQEKALAKEKETLMKDAVVINRRSSVMEELEEQIARTNEVLRKAQDATEVLELERNGPARVAIYQHASNMAK